MKKGLLSVSRALTVALSVFFLSAHTSEATEEGASILLAQLAGPQCNQCRQACAQQHEQGDANCCTQNGGITSGGSCSNPSNYMGYVACLSQVESTHLQCFANCQPICDSGS